MKKYWTPLAWVGNRWIKNVLLTVDSTGRLHQVLGDQLCGGAHPLEGPVIPGMPNVHSHAFQWTFAGLSEFRTRQRDSFWSWREQMYRSVEQLTPEEYYHRACELYRMMLAAGYTEVGEFHYIHNKPDGTRYPQLERLADQLVQAAVDTGIAICMLPVLYQRGGFDGRPLEGAQKRFELSFDELLSLSNRLQDKWGDQPLFQLGVAFHSLRAVDPKTIGPSVEAARAITGPCGPVHIHVAEQAGEVDQCQSQFGKRPVELLLDLADVDAGWCLIHATHMSEHEICRLAEIDAVVGLCPTTEANLGDGVFPAAEFLSAGGRIAMGSDSHVGLDPFAELRLVEYGQRLTTPHRAVLCDNDHSCGERLFRDALAGGAQAVGRSRVNGLEVGAPANWVVLDPDHATLSDCPAERIMDRLIFCQWGNAVLKTFVQGDLVFERHPLQGSTQCPDDWRKLSKWAWG